MKETTISFLAVKDFCHFLKENIFYINNYLLENIYIKCLSFVLFEIFENKVSEFINLLIIDDYR